MAAERRSRHPFFVYALLVIVVVATLIPVFWVVSSSFKTNFELFSLHAHWLPATPTLSSYTVAFASQGGVQAISNSLVIAFGGTFLALLIGFPSAYVISRWRIPFGLILPMVAGGVVAAAIFVFVLDWTEFTLALMLTRMQTQTIPLQMAAFNALGAISEGQGQAAALSTVSLAPFLIIAYFFQK